MGFMATGVAYPKELRERAVRLVGEAREADVDSPWNQIYKRIGQQIGVNPTTLRGWFNKSQGSGGNNTQMCSKDIQEIKELRRKVKELERANEILLAASSFFARELDPRLPF
jgi:transposase-like protein